MIDLPAVRCDHPVLRQQLVEWLAGSEIPLPPGFSLDVSVTADVAAPPDDRERISVADVEIAAGAPQQWVHISWRRAPAWACVDAERPTAVAAVSTAALDDLDYLLRSFFLATMIFIWRRAGWHHMHAATMIDPQGRGWMLTGTSNTGKSTTTALLASRGWRVSTDDIAFLQQIGDRVSVTGFRDRIALRPGGHELVRASGGTRLERRGKLGFTTEDLGSEWVRTVIPDIVVLTAVGGERTALTPISASVAFRMLVGSSPWVMFEPVAAQEHLDLLGRLAREARCYQASLAPDLFHAPGALADFLP